mgnify:FL=1
MLDKHASEEHRYNLLLRHRGAGRRGLSIVTSKDGFKWSEPAFVLPFSVDTYNQFFWDGRIGKYVIFVRSWDPWRKVGRIETDDILKPWPYRRIDPMPGTSNVKVIDEAFAYDELDPIVSDHYNPAATVYEDAQDAYFMFPTAFYHTQKGRPTPPPSLTDARVAPPKSHMTGPMDIQMAVSREGVRYHRPDRRPYVRLGVEGAIDSGSNYMAVGMVRSGDELFQYYVGYEQPHGYHDLLGTQHMNRWGAIIRTVQRVDGFVSADASYSGGWLLTPPITFTGKRLELNVDTSAIGSAYVAIEEADGKPVPNFTFEDCDLINGNFPHKIVTWKGNPDVSSLAGRPIRLRVKMRSTKLYAFQFLP